jgi:hypothetical protein
MDARSKPIALKDPESALMVHASAQGTWTLSRRAKSGEILWSVDTGLDRLSLQRIFPGMAVTAFVGSRPPVPGKLSEPLVVLIDNTTGKTTSHTMWR